MQRLKSFAPKPPIAIDWTVDAFFKRLSKVEAVVAAARANDPRDLIVYDPKTRPYNHQRFGTAYLVASQHCLLLDDMGLGKTKQAVDAVHYLYGQHKAIMDSAKAWYSTVLWVCPNSIKHSIKSDIEKHGDPDIDRVIIPSGTIVSRAVQLRSKEARHPHKINWIILNYESISLLGDAFLELAEQSILICDEAHRLKSSTTHVTMAVKKARPIRLWLMTGTPIANRPEDLYSLINLVRPGLCGWRWHSFEARHITRNFFGGISGYKNLDELRDKLAMVSFGRRKEQCLDLPGKIYTSVSIDLNAEERRAYDTMYVKMMTALEEDEVVASNYAVRFAKLRQITNGFLINTQDETVQWAKHPSKIKALIDAWESSGRKRCVVWVYFRALGHKIAEELEKVGAKHAVIDGTVSPDERYEYIKLWNSTDGMVLIGQMDSLGEGVNLQAGDLEIFVDRPLTPKQRRQCVDRLHRIGQERPVTIVDIIARKTVDAKIHNALMKKIEMASDVESGAIPTVQEVMDAADEVQ